MKRTRHDALGTCAKVLLPMAAAIVLTSCATLSEEECRNADWRTIGFEDGLHGYPESRIGSHRKACAEHGVTPDLNLYTAGRRQGLQTYCRPRNGYRIGTRNGHYNGVCPSALEKAFVAAIERGRELYNLEQHLRSQQQALKEQYDHLDRVEKEAADKENLLVREGIGPKRRRQLLADIRRLESEQQELLQMITEQEAQVSLLDQELNDTRAHNPYP